MIQRPYQTVVVSGDVMELATDLSVLAGAPEAGTAANVTAGTEELAREVVGPFPNALRPSTRYPHVFALRRAGAVGVPLRELIIPPWSPVIWLEVAVLLNESVYPVLEPVLTSTRLFDTEQVVEVSTGVTLTATDAFDASEIEQL